MANVTRNELKQYFQKGKIPTQAQFEALIDSGLNQLDDRIRSSPNDPLTLLPAADAKGLLQFGESDPTGNLKPTWLIRHELRSPDELRGPAIPGLLLRGPAIPGLLFQDAKGIPAIFLQGETGNVGIGTTTPAGRLQVVDAECSLRFAAEGGAAVLRVQNPAHASLAVLDLGNDTRHWQLRVDGGDGNKFKLCDATRVYTPVTVDTAGNVGIGTEGPGSRLVISDGTNGVSLHPGAVSGIGFNRNVADGKIYNSGISAWQFTARDAHFALEGYNGALTSWAVTKAGNVGIGTTSPQRKLQISDDVNGLGFDPGTSPNAGVFRFGDNTGWKLHFGRSREASGGAPNVSTNGLLMTIQDNGCVGIGTTNPSANLQLGVLNNAAPPNSSLAVGTSNGVSLNVPAVRISMGVNNDANYGGYVGTLWMNATTGQVATVLGTREKGTDFPNSVVVTRGNVGIATNTPSAKLEVNGDVRIDDCPLWLRGGTDKNHAIAWRDQFAGMHIDGPVVFGYAGGGLGLNPSGQEKLALCWNQACNVGIGTKDPKATLHITGTHDGPPTLLIEHCESPSLAVLNQIPDDSLVFTGPTIGADGRPRLTFAWKPSGQGLRFFLVSGDFVSPI